MAWEVLILVCLLLEINQNSPPPPPPSEHLIFKIFSGVHAQRPPYENMHLDHPGKHASLLRRTCFSWKFSISYTFFLPTRKFFTQENMLLMKMLHIIYFLPAHQEKNHVSNPALYHTWSVLPYIHCITHEVYFLTYTASPLDVHFLRYSVSHMKCSSLHTLYHTWRVIPYIHCITHEVYFLTYTVSHMKCTSSHTLYHTWSILPYIHCITHWSALFLLFW